MPIISKAVKTIHDLGTILNNLGEYLKS